MNPFGTRLRQLRQLSSTDNGKKITQQDLGDFLGQELGSSNFSNVTISNWENGRTNINKDDRLVLLALIKIFIRFNVLESIDACNEFLLLGNYRALNEEELRKLALIEYQSNTIEQSASTNKEEKHLPERKWPHVFAKDPYYHLPSRAAMMDDVVNSLVNSDSKKVIKINGIGGIGKTAFALEIARRLIEQGSFSRLIGDNANDRLLIGDEVMQLRFEDYSFPELWNSLAMQLNRNDLIDQNVYFSFKELLSQFQEENLVCLIDGIERMKKHRVLYVANKVNLGRIRLILASRIIKSHLDFINVTLNGLPVEDTILFLKKEAVKSKKEKYLPLLRKDIDRVRDVSGGIPVVLQYILEKINSSNLDIILEDITNGTSPLFDFIYGNEWQQLDEDCCKYLIGIAKKSLRQQDSSYLYEFDYGHNQVEIKSLMQAYSLGFLEQHKIGNESQYFLNSFTYHYLCSQE